MPRAHTAHVPTQIVDLPQWGFGKVMIDIGDNVRSGRPANGENAGMRQCNAKRRSIAQCVVRAWSSLDRKRL